MENRLIQTNHPPEVLEIHLIRTQPREKIPRKVKMRVKVVTHRYHLFSPGSFPRGVRCPENCYTLSEKCPKITGNLKLLGLTCSQGKLYSFKGDEVGLVWKGAHRDPATLGRRNFLSNQQPAEGIDHTLILRKLGDERTVHPNPQLNELMETLLAKSPRLKSLIAQNEFEITCSEVTHIIEIKLADRTGTRFSQAGVFHTLGKFWSIDDADTNVVNEVREIVQHHRMRRTIGFYSIMVKIREFTQEWLEEFETIDRIPDESVDIKLFEGFYMFKDWIQATFKYFLLPLIECICPGFMIGEVPPNPPESQTNQSKFIRAVPFLLHLMAAVSKLDESIQTAIQLKTICLFKGYWSEIIRIFGASFASIINTIQNLVNELMSNVETRSHLTLCFQCEFEKYDISHPPRVVPGYQAPGTLNLTDVEVRQIFDNVLNIFRKNFLRDIFPSWRLLMAIKFNWLAARNLKRTNYLVSAYHDKLDLNVCEVKAAVAYHHLIILFYERTLQYATEPELCLLEKGKVPICHQYPSDWHMDRNGMTAFITKESIWSDGTCVSLARRGTSELFLFYIDFKPCARDMSCPPLFKVAKLPDFPLRNLESLKRGNSFTYGFESLFLVNYQCYTLPSLLMISLQDARVSPPVEVSWTRHLPTSHLRKFTGYNREGAIRGIMHTCCASGTRMLFFCMIDPDREVAPEFKRFPDLKVLCFKKCLNTLSLKLVSEGDFTMPLGLVPTNIVLQPKEVTSKFINGKEREFLLLRPSPSGQHLLLAPIGKRLHMLKVNGVHSVSLPPKVNTELRLFGLETNYLHQCNYRSWYDLFAGSYLYEIQRLHFTF